MSRTRATYAFSSNTSASTVTPFCQDGRIEGQASDDVFADDDGCRSVRSENVEELLAPAWSIRERSGNKQKQFGLGTRYVHNWTSPVTCRNEQPIPVTHFAITCQRSTAASKNQTFLNLRSLPFLGRDVHPLHAYINPTSSTRLGSSLTISGARDPPR